MNSFGIAVSTAKTPIHPIEQAKRDLTARSTVSIDHALSALGSTRQQRIEQKTTAYMDILARAVINASDAPKPGPDDDPVETMLTDRKCDRMACASLLRLLIVDDEVFSTDRRLRLSTALFDRALAKSLYPEAELTPNDQAFAKRDRLRTLVEGHEEALFSHVKSLGSLDALAPFRQRFGKLFGAPGTRAFVAPFLPGELTVQYFDELLAALQALVACTDVSLVSRSEAVQKRCDMLKGLVDRSGTRYAQELAATLATTVERLARERVDAAGFADPAQLSVEVRPKRYPFGHTKVPVTVRLDLTNEGPGQAQDVLVEIEGGGAISFDETSKAIGLLAPGTRQIDFHGIVVDGNGRGGADIQSDLLMINVKWKNPDRSEERLEEITTLKAQSGDVPWSNLALEQPYHLEPVTDPKDFVGRRAAVSDLVKVILQSGNARIQGEKRVGKTSLAYAVKAAVEQQQPGHYVFLHLESGDFNTHTAEATVSRLGELIANQVRRSDRRLSGLEIPDFTPGLATLTEFFEAVKELAPDKEFVIVLDEFDALPHESLYKHEPIGDAFFQTLRSLGGKENIHFILIGGERMQWVIATHGQTLNKFKLVPLDYFAQDQIEDYAELVRAPVEGQLYYAEEAIDALYEASAGNPWMTKRILGKLFERQVERRDRDIQPDDVEDAIHHALPELSVTSFQHFWDDAIRGDVDDHEHVSATRRRVLLALARCIQGPGDVTEEAVLEEARNFNVDEPAAREVIRGLLDRSILKVDNGSLVCRVPLFEWWLVRHGAQEIILGTGDDDTLIRRQRAIEEMRPTVEEMDVLVSQWKSYRGKELRPDQVGRWLEQFGGPREQRLIMPILEGLRFYTRAKIDQQMRDLHQFVLRELASRGYKYKLSGQQRYRNDFLVCGLEGGGSGAAHLLKQYRDENGIYSDCAVDASALRQALDTAKQTIRAVIVIDDFVGTGGTAASRLQELHDAWTEEREWPASVDVFLLAISAFDSGKKRVERAVSQFGWPVTIRVGDVFDNADRCFHEESSFYTDSNDREQAQALCARFGALTSARTPFGFGRTEAAVCFEYRCPNNTLPVLWSKGPDWEPLFARL